jgi:hypothetical protein
MTKRRVMPSRMPASLGGVMTLPFLTRKMLSPEPSVTMPSVLSMMTSRSWSSGLVAPILLPRWMASTLGEDVVEVVEALDAGVEALDGGLGPVGDDDAHALLVHLGLEELDGVGDADDAGGRGRGRG